MKRIIYILLLLCCSVAVSAQDAELLKKAQSGDAEAQYKLSEYYLPNTETVSEEGLKWLKLAAENGNAEAQWTMAKSFLRGWYGMTKNDEQYVFWLSKAANNPDLENNKNWISSAQFWLGELYEEGAHGVEKNISEFIRWAKKAAFNGYGSAAFSLGLYYKNAGNDKQEAIYWYKKCMDIIWADRQEEYELAFNSLKELGVTYHPADHVGHNHQQSTASSTTTTSSGSSDYSVQSKTTGNNKPEPIAKGVYSVNSQGSSSYGYAGYGGDYMVNVEFYDDFISVNNIRCEYKGMQNGKKRYESSLKTSFAGGSSTVYYVVDDDFNMQQQTYMSSPYGSNWVYNQMAKGEVIFPKHSITGYGNANQQNNYSSEGSGNSNSNSRGNTVKSYTQDCHLCHGSGKCNTCNGTHRYLNHLTNKYITCPNCKPNGLCSACGGTGKK